MLVTRTISALEEVGLLLAGQMVALNGTAGKRAPSPAATTNEVPDVAGLGAVAIVL